MQSSQLKVSHEFQYEWEKSRFSGHICAAPTNPITDETVTYRQLCERRGKRL